MSRALTVVRLSKIVELVLAELGLTLNQYRMLTFISAGAPPLSEISARLAMKPPNVSALTDGLVDRELASRSRSPEDRRRVELSLTKAGTALLREAERRCDGVVAHLARQVEDEQALLDGLDAWARVLDEVAIGLLRERLRSDGDRSEP